MVEALAAQAPHWEPGTRHGYHMRTYGWLAGELVRRVDGRSVGQFLRDEIADPGGHFNYDEMWNTRALRAAELPSSNGHGDARSLARLYAACIGAIDGVRVLQPATVARATQVEARGPDEVLMVESAFGLGFMLGTSFGTANPVTAFGHAGAGGSLAFADPDHDFAFGYVMNDLRFDPAGDPRSERLVRAVRRALG